MKKKRIAIAVSIMLGILLIVGAAIANAANSTGYDAYKTALKNTRSATSLTAQVTASVTDNGNAVLNGSGAVKANLKNENMSGTGSCTAGDKNYSAEVYRQNGQSVTKTSDSDVYYVMQHQERNNDADKAKNSQLEQNYAKDLENVIDAFLGNITNNVVATDNSDGTKDISLQLSGNQIPATLNALASLAVKAEERHGIDREADLSPTAAAIKAQIPQLVDNITVSNVDIKAQIDGQNYIKSQQMNISLSGNDAKGVSHSLVVTVNVEFSDINNTIPDTVDLTGKQVKTIQHNYHDFKE